jgi:hypothetical protein
MASSKLYEVCELSPAGDSAKGVPTEELDSTPRVLSKVVSGLLWCL